MLSGILYCDANEQYKTQKVILCLDKVQEIH